MWQITGHGVGTVSYGAAGASDTFSLTGIISEPFTRAAADYSDERRQ